MNTFKLLTSYIVLFYVRTLYLKNLMRTPKRLTTVTTTAIIDTFSLNF